MLGVDDAPFTLGDDANRLYARLGRLSGLRARIL
jgi:hypothetical protein